MAGVGMGGSTSFPKGGTTTIIVIMVLECGKREAFSIFQHLVLSRANLFCFLIVRLRVSPLLPLSAGR